MPLNRTVLIREMDDIMKEADHGEACGDNYYARSKYLVPSGPL